MRGRWRRYWPALLNLPLAAAVLLAALGCPRTPSGTGTSTVPASGEAPWFEDVTAKVRLNFVHQPGPIPQPKQPYFMPQIIGSGGAAFDFDGDGRLDVYLIHNVWKLGSAKNQLFHQEADGTFKDVSAGSGLDVSGYGQGVAIADVNNNGRPDVLLTEYGKIRLFLNEGGGKFREVTDAGLDSTLWATSAAFFDYDRDGRLDLVITNYLDYDPTLKCGAVKLDYCTPNPFNGVVTKLYHNVSRDGQVRFEDVTEQAGLGKTLAKGLGVLCADFNGDGWPDIFVANDQLPNFLWINDHHGHFKEEALARGVAYGEGGQPLANMGVAWADVDGDGLPDLFVTHINDQLHTLWKQGPPGKFQDRTMAAGLNLGWRSTGFGTAFVDFDRDGSVDLAWVNGGVFRNKGAEPDFDNFWASYAQRNQLFANRGDGTFRDISESNPALCGTPVVARGLIVADLDNDGAPDLITTEIAGPARVLRNVAPARGHWLAVRATLPQYNNRDAYGAEVTVRAGGRSFWRLLNPGYSYCVSNDPRGHFGLGAMDRYDKILVLWPDGKREAFPAGPADREVTLRQGEGQPVE